ncbi:exodeoxyribonuclease VII large subunit [Mucilaginibacter terrae]|uniref:exodeoxyribonuclease VII large subunit n=1 Tax=Mucilaginibacter terrae TaxID=1955052 RepID=UPI00362C61F1
MSSPENTSPISLSELAGLVKGVVEQALGRHTFWVIADVANHNQKSGRHYFDLLEKDAAGVVIVAKIPTRAWAEGVQKILAFEKVTGQAFTTGLKILSLVSVAYNPIYGLQLTLMDIDPNFTLGVLERQRKETLLRLITDNPQHVWLADGLYVTLNQNLPLPKVIQRIAVISSAVSAGLEDFQHTLDHNTFGYEFKIDRYYSYVQGENNAQSVVDQFIAIFNSGIAYDAAVLIRGGGSQTDLLIFEHYNIARVIARFPIPVFTGIGHQKNETIADLMAHTALKTPTKAAEFMVAHNKAFFDELLSLEKSILIKTQQSMARHKQLFSLKKNEVSMIARTYISQHVQQLHQKSQGITHLGRSVLSEEQSRLRLLSGKLSGRAQLLLYGHRRNLFQRSTEIGIQTKNYLAEQDKRIAAYQSELHLISPDRLLRRGYALIKKNGKILGRADKLEKGNEIAIILADREVSATVNENKKHDGSDFNI